MNTAIAELKEKGRVAKEASRWMAYLSAEVKNQALHNISVDLITRVDEILVANQVDYKEAQISGMSAASGMVFSATKTTGPPDYMTVTATYSFQQLVPLVKFCPCTLSAMSRVPLNS